MTRAGLRARKASIHIPGVLSSMAQAFRKWRLAFIISVGESCSACVCVRHTIVGSVGGLVVSCLRLLCFACAYPSARPRGRNDGLCGPLMRERTPRLCVLSQCSWVLERACFHMALSESILHVQTASLPTPSSPQRASQATLLPFLAMRVQQTQVAMDLLLKKPSGLLDTAFNPSAACRAPLAVSSLCPAFIGPRRSVDVGTVAVGHSLACSDAAIVAGGAR